MTTKLKIPKIRFKEFSGGWEEKKLGEVCTFFSGGTPLTSKKEYYNGNIPFIKSGEINKSKTEQFITDLGLNNSSAKLVDKGDLLYALYGATSGQVGISKINGAINQAVLCIKTKENTFFLYTILKNKKDSILEKFLQGGQGNLSADIVKSFKFLFPSLPEQQKIASFLSSVDEKIEKIKEKKKNLEEYKKGVMQKIFSQEIRFKDENGEEFGEWKIKKLGEILKESSNKTTINNQYDVLSSTSNELVLQSEYFNRQIASKDNIGYKIIKRNQIVFSPQNLWLGNINLNLKYDIGIVSPSYKIFDINTNVCLVKYTSYFLKSNRMLFEYAQASEQGASIVRRNLDINSFNSIKVNLPTLKEQEKIADFFSGIDEKIEKISDELEKMEEFKKGLLQGMFV